MSEHFDTLETRHPEERERSNFAMLPRQIAHAKKHAPAFGKLLRDVDANAVTTREALARLPVTRKAELAKLQAEARPFGGFAASGWGTMARAFASPGGIYEPEGRRPDWWRLGRALHAAGFRRGELVHNCFAYHLTPAGFMLESGAQALGCTVFPGGTGQTELQAQAIADLRPSGYVGTPSFLRIILEKADELRLDVSSLRKALVSGEAFLPPHREALRKRGIEALQAYASADLGSIAYESHAREGLIVDEGVLVEIVRPGTNDPVPPGEVGEVVVTTLVNADYPLIRFGTGDLSAVLAGISPCGRTNLRIKGWMGRADQTAKVKGMFVRPDQVAEIAKRHPELKRLRLVITRRGETDAMTLRAEAVAGPDLHAKVAATLQDVAKLRGDVELVAPGSLPNDGKVIADERTYD